MGQAGKKITAIYPGTFDPLTNGHLDLIARGAKIVDELVVAILRNSEKGAPLFTVPEREEMLREATQQLRQRERERRSTGCWWTLRARMGRRRCCAGFARSRTMSTSSRWR